MKKTAVNLIFLFGAVAVMGLSLWGPELLAHYRDRTVLDRINTRTSGMEGEGYRYKLAGNEKLYILSECLNSQSLPESEQNALTRMEEESYQELGGTYAFVSNHKGPTGKEITSQEIFTTCNEMLQSLKMLGILPESVKEVRKGEYEAALYSAIDVLEPRNHVSVWKVSLSTDRKNADKANRLIDAYLDAEDGKVYEFYARTDQSWEELDPDLMIGRWSEYMGLDEPEGYETDNPLMETTPYYRNYVFPGMGDASTVVTIGFYDGINELFLKISK